MSEIGGFVQAFSEKFFKFFYFLFNALKSILNCVHVNAFNFGDSSERQTVAFSHPKPLALCFGER
jgi:hypothetical protein